MNIDPEVLEAVAATAALMNTELSKPAARMFCEDLAGFPADRVLNALTRCRREVKGRLTLAEVLDRIEDGHPGPEEAWALVPKTERESAFVTEEMMTAWAVAQDQIAAGDRQRYEARQAFCEVYRRVLSKAREQGKPAKFRPSMGDYSTPQDRAGAILLAAETKRISNDAAAHFMAQHAPNGMTDLRRLSHDGPQRIGQVLKLASSIGRVS